MRASILLAASAAALLAACGQQATTSGGKEAAASAADAIPLGKLSGDATPSAYRLNLTINPDEETFSGTVDIDVDLSRELSQLWLHGEGLDMKDVYATTADGTRVPAQYEQLDVLGVSRLTFDSSLPKGAVTLHADYTAPFNTGPDGLYRAEEGGLYYAATQFESISARKAFMGFDEPKFKTPFDITVVAPTGDVVVTTTPEVSADDLGDGMTRHVFKQTKPLPTYLLSFLVGPYDVNEWTPIPPNDVRKTPLPLRGFAAKGKGARMDYALKNTADIIRLEEEYFATPYPYAKLDLGAPPKFFGGAMENAGNVLYHEYLMLLDENSSLNQRRVYETVHAHELAHQWFGDYVTPAWWDDIWLNEAFASWMENKIAQAAWPEGQFSRTTLQGGLGAMGADSLANARQIRNPVATNAEIDDSFDGITYEKGAAVLAMFESYLGVDKFREGVRTHMKRFAYGTATADDFMKSLADGSGEPDVVPAFRSFIDQPGVPLVEASLDCDGAPTLKLKQSRYAPLGSTIDTHQTWSIPMCAAYGDGEKTGETCGMITTAQAEMPLNVDTCPAYVVPNGDGSGYFRFSLDEAGWAALAKVGARLTPEQALVYADSLKAALYAGAASADAALDGFTALSRHDAWDVVSTAANRFENLDDLLPDEAARDQLKKLTGETFAPVLAGLGDADDPQSSLQRTSLLRLMAIVAEDPSIRADMLTKARAYVGMNGAPDPSAIAPDVLDTVLSVGVQEDGEPFFDKLLAMVRASGDPALRGDGIGALARTEDTALTVRLLDTLLEPEFPATELNQGLRRQLVRDATQDVAWDWLQQNFDKFVERNGGIFATRGIVAVGGSFCSADKKAEYEKMILDHKDQLPGYERTFAQSLEAIDLCMAIRKDKGEELASAIAARL